jgi:hypothetical protein
VGERESDPEDAMERIGARIGVLAVVACMLGASGCSTPSNDLQAREITGAETTTTTIILVRHAERDPGADPPLNAEGQRRAQALLTALGENGVTAIHCTDLQRNRETVQPLAEALGLSPHLINPARYVNTTVTADELVNEILAGERGGTVLLCGNIGSVLDTPGILEQVYRRLGGTGEVPHRYRDLFVVLVPADGAARFIKAEYGGVSSLD